MSALLDRLSDNARMQGAINAVSDRSTGEWRWRTWAELESDVNRLCEALPVRRGQRLEWDAPAGSRRLAIDLALLHLGVVGVAGGEGIGVDQYEQWLATREDPGRLVRLRAELRARDAAAERSGRVLDYTAVEALTTRVAEQLAVAGADSVLVAADPSVEQLVGWGVVWSGAALIIGGAEQLAALHPAVWVATPAAVIAAAPPASRAGGLGGLLRPYGRTAEHLGRRLRRVLVVGAVPAEGDRYRQRGVEVVPWMG